MSFYERGDDRGFQNSQRMENLWAVEIISLRLRPTRSFFDGSAAGSKLRAQWSTAVLPLYSVAVLFWVGYLVSDLSFDDRAKLSTEIVA
jgi:hypothetical protein